MDPYQVLNIDKSASTHEIKKAYRKLAVIYHPDKKTGNEEHYKKIAIAYELLSNEKKRKEYDSMNSVSQIRLYDILQNIVPSEYINLTKSIIDFFYSEDFREDIDNCDIESIKWKIVRKISSINIIDIIKIFNPETENNKSDVINVDINCTIGVTLKEIFNKNFKKICVKRIRGGEVDIGTFIIPILCDVYVLEGEGDIVKDNIGDLIIDINEEKHDYFNKIADHDLIYYKEITYYDYIYGCAFKFKYLDDSTINIKLPELSNGNITNYTKLTHVIPNMGLPKSYYNDKRGDLFIHMVLKKCDVGQNELLQTFGSVNDTINDVDIILDNKDIIVIN